MSIDTELSGRLGIRDGVNARVLSKNGENHTMQNILLRKKNTFSTFLHNKISEGAKKKEKKLKKNCKNMKKNPFFI